MRTENEIGNKLFGPPLKRQGCGRIFQGPHNAVFGRKAFSMKTWCVQRFLCLTTLTLTLALPTTLRADVIFSSFGAGNSYNTVSGNGIGLITVNGPVLIQADAFTVTGNNFTLNTVTLALSSISGGNTATVSLQTDAGGKPSGTVLESWTATAGGAFGINHAVTVLNSILNPSLTQGQQYWLVADAGASSHLSWNLNDVASIGGRGVSTNGGAFATFTGPHGAFAVEGTVGGGGGGGVPEPTTLALFGVGALGLLSSRLRRRIA